MKIGNGQIFCCSNLSFEVVFVKNSGVDSYIYIYIVERKILEMRRGCSIKCQNIICFVFKYIHECISTNPTDSFKIRNSIIRNAYI